MPSKTGISIATMMVAMLLAGAAPSIAQEDWDWQYDLSLTAIGLGKEGFIRAPYAVNNANAHFPPGLFDDLSTCGGIGFRARQARWTIMLDVFALNYDTRTRTGIAVDADQILAELVTTYRVANSFHLLAGTRYSKLDSDLVFPGTPAPFNRVAKSEWADLLVGGQLVVPAGNRMTFTLRGDAGGFGLASDLVIHALLKMDFKLADAASLSLGYRYWDYDFENYKDVKKLIFDMTLAGPTLGVVFHF